MSWCRYIGGRVKSDYSYSGNINYNPFPYPPLTTEQAAQLDDLGKAILASRDRYPESTLADLYDPDAMPPDLRKAHRALDAAVDRIYRREPFSGDRERVEHLFMLYERKAAGLFAVSPRKTRPRIRSKVR